jgi:hypothetical protein
MQLCTHLPLRHRGQGEEGRVQVGGAALVKHVQVRLHEGG